MSYKITFFDLETTDKAPMGNEILTSFFRTRDAESFDIIDESYLEFKPEKYRVESFAIHGISEERAKTFPNKWESFSKLINNMIKQKDSLFCCHANGFMFGQSGYFDKQVISSLCFERGYSWYIGFERAKFKFISTHSIAKKLIPESDLKVNREINPVTNKPFSAYSLENIARYFGYKYKAHQVKEDVKALEFVFKKLIKSSIPIDQLIELSRYDIKETNRQYDEHGLPIFENCNY